MILHVEYCSLLCFCLSVCLSVFHSFFFFFLFFGFDYSLLVCCLVGREEKKKKRIVFWVLSFVRIIFFCQTALAHTFFHLELGFLRSSVLVILSRPRGMCLFIFLSNTQPSLNICFSHISVSVLTSSCLSKDDDDDNNDDDHGFPFLLLLLLLLLSSCLCFVCLGLD
jgi:hypothetical protein